VSTVLVGASKLEQLEDNLGAADLRLTATRCAGSTRPAARGLLSAWFNERLRDPRIDEALAPR